MVTVLLWANDVRRLLELDLILTALGLRVCLLCRCILLGYPSLRSPAGVWCCPHRSLQGEEGEAPFVNVWGFGGRL